MKEMQQKIHALNVKNGFWPEGDFDQIQKLTLIATEAIEAFEEIRKDKPAVYVKEDNRIFVPDDFNSSFFLDGDKMLKPEGELMELADVVIRCLDLMAKIGAEYIREVENDDKNFGLFWSNFYYWILKNLTHDDPMSLSELNLSQKLNRVVYLCFKYSEYKGWDLERAIEVKYEFNVTRPFKHGKKF